MGASQVPATTGSDNFVLISSVTPTASVNTISFTSISGYKKLALLVKDPGLSANASVSVTFNSDTGSNYPVSFVSYNDSTGALYDATSTITTGIQIFAGAASGIAKAHLIIENTDTTGMKTFSGLSGYNNPGVAVANPTISGAYYATAAITTVTLTITTSSVNFTAAGTVALYGVAS